MSTEYHQKASLLPIRRLMMKKTQEWLTRRPERHPGNANLCFQGFAAHDILGALQPRLAASTGSACSTGIPEPSHVLKAIGLSDINVDSSIRFSFGRRTTDTDVTEAINMIEDVLAKLSKEGLVSTA